MAREWIAVAMDNVDLDYFEWRKEKCSFAFDEVHFLGFVKVGLFVDVGVFQFVRLSLRLHLELFHCGPSRF